MAIIVIISILLLFYVMVSIYYDFGERAAIGAVFVAFLTFIIMFLSFWADMRQKTLQAGVSKQDINVVMRDAECAEQEASIYLYIKERLE